MDHIKVFFKKGKKEIQIEKSCKVTWDTGLEVIHADEDAIIDIVFVHGLNGDPTDTYRYVAPNGEACFWIKDLLPETLRKDEVKSRIFSYGYNANTHGGPISVQSVWDHGEQFLSCFVDARLFDRTQDRPVIIVAYSLGGLVVKSALVSSHLSSPQNDPNLKSLSLSTHAIFFFGVPHQGADGDIIDIGQICINILGAVRNTSRKIIDFMEPNNEALKGLFENYKRIQHLFHQRSFWELFETEITLKGIGVRRILVVPKASAVPPGEINTQPTGIHKDHSNLVRYKGESDPDYVTVSRALVLETRKSFKVISDNWVDWQRQLRIYQNTPQRLSTNWPFPPDHRFKGRRDELKGLEIGLQNHGAIRTTSVTGPGGIGKTSLVLQYAYTQREKYSFIVWVHARTKSLAEDGFIWVLQQLVRLAVEDAPQRAPDFLRIARDLRIEGLLDSEGKLLIADDAQDQRDRAVGAVKSWLERQQDRSWLVIFDEYDNLDYRLRDFYAACNWGQYIITSRRPAVADYATDHLQLQGMTPTDALDMFLSESQRNREDPEIARLSNDIIKMLEYHPLAIDSAAVYLCRRPFISLGRYIEIFNNKRRDIPPQELLDGTDRLWPDYNLTCMTTFEISEEAIHTEMPNASKLLQLCCWLDKDNIWIHYLRRHPEGLGAGISGDNIDDYIALLYSYSMVRPKVGEDFFSIHTMIHIWGRVRLESHERIRTMISAFKSLQHAPYRLRGGIIELPSVDDYSLQRSAINHLEYILDVADEYLGIGSLRCAIANRRFGDQELRNDILSALDESFSALKTFTDREFPDLSSHKPSPLCITDQLATDNEEEFRNLQKEALLALQTIPGILLEQARLNTATRFQLRTLLLILTFEADYFKMLAQGEEFQFEVFTSLILLARLLHQVGELSTAQRLLMFAVNDLGTRLPLSDEIRQQARIMLTLCLRDLNEKIDENESEDLLDIGSFINMFEFQTSVVDENGDFGQPTAVLESIKLLANNLMENYEFQDAREIFELLTEKRKKMLPNGNAEYLVSRFDLGNCLRLEGTLMNQSETLEAARSILEETMKEMTAEFGELDFRTVRCVSCLGLTFLSLGDSTRAEFFLSEAVITYKDVQANPLDKLDFQGKLAYARFLQHKYPLAEQQQRRAVSTSINLRSISDRATLEIIIDWARTLLRMGYIAEPGNLLIYALEEKRRQGSMDRAAWKAWAGLAELAENMKSKGLIEKANLMERMKKCYDMDIFLSVMGRGVPTNEGLCVPELRVSFPVQVVRLVDAEGEPA